MGPWSSGGGKGSLLTEQLLLGQVTTSLTRTMGDPPFEYGAPRQDWNIEDIEWDPTEVRAELRTACSVDPDASASSAAQAVSLRRPTSFLVATPWLAIRMLCFCCAAAARLLCYSMAAMGACCACIFHSIPLWACMRRPQPLRARQHASE